MKTTTWASGYECHLGRDGRTCVVSQEFATHQTANNGKTTIALLRDGSRMRVKLVGSDYGLDTPGTGDMIVRPVRRIAEGQPRRDAT